MDGKKKAAKLINTALGLIVILAVILASPLFGYGLGIATAEQRRAAAEAVAEEEYYQYQNPNATPRPTPQPTPTPVVLPSAPPTPEPTPEPTPRPKPVVNSQPVQQNWQQEAYLEEEYTGEEEESADNTEEPVDYAGLGEQPVENSSGELLVETENADIVIQTGGDTPAADPVAPMPEPVAEPEPAPEQPAAQIQQDSSEGEAFLIG